MAKRTAAGAELRIGWNYLKAYRNSSKTEQICRYVLRNAGDEKKKRAETSRDLHFLYFFFFFVCLFWNIAFQMPASLRMCKMRTLLTAPSMSWNRDSQKIFTSAKDDPVQPPFPLDWWVSSCHWGEAVTGKQCPPLLAEFTAGTVQSRELSLVVSHEEWCDCLSLQFLKPLNEWEGPFGVQAYWHRFSWKHIALWINIKWKGCNTT